MFNHHERRPGERITRLQHAHHDLTVSSMRAHQDHDGHLETVVLWVGGGWCGKVDLIGVEPDVGSGGHGHVHTRPST
ncbi:MAG TPA: hypothetical protein VIO81_03555 [Methyloversatilis sp.]